MSSSGPVSKSHALAVPLPTALPEALPLDQLPSAVLHSATVEALLQQIDDLTARLKVNLRRNSLLEMDLRKAKENLEFFKERNQSLELKSLVDKEKESSAEQRFLRLSDRIKELEGQISIYELRLSKTVTETRDLQEQRQSLEKRTKRFHGLRARAKARLKNYLNKQAQQLRETNLKLASELEHQRASASKFSSQLADVRTLLESATERLQQKEQETRELQERLENEFRGQLSELQSLLNSKEEQLKSKVDMVSTLQGELVAAEGLHNETIHLKDRLKAQKEYFELEVAQLQKSVRSYRLEAKSLGLEKMELARRLQECESELQSQKDYTQRLEDQLESAHLILYPDSPHPEQDPDQSKPEVTL